MGVEVKEHERRLLGQEVGRPQLCSLVGPPGSVGTAGYHTGSVPNACLCGALNLGPEREAASRESAGAAIVGQNLPEYPSCGKRSACGVTAYFG